MVQRRFPFQAGLGEGLPEHHRHADRGERHAGRLADEGHRPRRPRVHLEDEDLAVLHGALQVAEAAHVELQRKLPGDLADPVEHVRTQAECRQHHRGVAAVHAGLLDVLHDPAHDHVDPVTHRVHIHLEGVLQEAVDEDRPVR